MTLLSTLTNGVKNTLFHLGTLVVYTDDVTNFLLQIQVYSYTSLLTFQSRVQSL